MNLRKEVRLMKTLTLLIFGVFIALSGRAQSNYIAEAITPEIQSLSRGLENDPVRIFQYVHDHIKHVFYFGSKKGAQLTLLEGCGNDFDQCALLVSLLRAAGYTNNVGYQYGWAVIPFDSPDHNDMHHWLGLSMTNASWTDVTNYFNYVMSPNERGYIAPNYFSWAPNAIGVQHVWVLFTNNATVYTLDPAFKISEPVPGINLASAMGLNTSNLLSAAGGTNTSLYVRGLNEANIRGTLQGYNSNLLAYIQNNYPNASVQDILGGQRIVPWTNGLATSLPFSIFANTWNPLLSWQAIPTNCMATFTIGVGGASHFWWFPQLAGQKLSLTFSNNGVAQLWLEDTSVFQTNISSKTGGSSTIPVTFTCTFPYGATDGSGLPVSTGGNHDFSKSQDYKATNSSYAILYCFEPGVKWLHERQQVLNQYIQQGYTNGSRQVVTESLNVMGLSWMTQTKLLGDDLLGQQMGILPESLVRLGRMSQEQGNGYYVDAYCQLDRWVPNSGVTAADQLRQNQYFDVKQYFGSAMEHAVIEQLNSTGMVAASTMKLLQLANTNQNFIYLVNSSNWTAGVKVRNMLTSTYTTAALSALDAAIANGDYLLLPTNGSIQVSGAGSYKGEGYVDNNLTSGSRSVNMVIGGGYMGGFSAFPTAVIDTSYLFSSATVQPVFFNNAPQFLPPTYSADPVNMADASFQVGETDLSLGSESPNGIAFYRSYNPNYKNVNLANMASGWVHNYYFNLATVSAPEAVLGQSTPAQMSSILVASCVAANLYNSATPDPKNWLTTALVTKWGIDQTISNAVSVSLGANTMQFTRQPDGSLTPPAGSTWTLTNNGTFKLQERHGRTFAFNANKQLVAISNQYGATLSLTYTGTNLTQVKDWKNRTLTLAYSGNPSRLASITDSVNRAVNYTYVTNTDGKLDLASVSDAVGAVASYGYDSLHQMTATFDALGRLVVTNVYDSQGRVATQLTQGVTNKTWQVYWSDWQTVSQDPVGGKTRYYYDDQHRLLAQSDALGNTSQSVYDGQNHVVQTVSPLNETNQFVYDGNQNLLQSIDANGFTNQSFYDSQNNLIRSVDPRGNSTTFGYNTQFSKIGQTNGAGDWVSYAYNTDGTLKTSTDAGGQTSYGYDSYGQLQTVAYPNNLGGFTNYNNVLGDVTNHIDGRGFGTTNQYNARRVLTNTIAPNGATVKIRLDAVGNVVSTTDALGNVTSNTWSVTRHLLATTCSATSQGVPVVTNSYDNQDRLTQTVDPLKGVTSFTNDLLGRLISVTDPLLRTATFGFDQDGRKLASTNAGNEVIRQTWDVRGSLLALTDGAGHVSSRAYDAAGNQIALTNRNNNTWHFQFDAANRLTNTITPLGRSAFVLFNHQGLAILAKDMAGQFTTNGFDAKGRLTNRADIVGSTVFSFDANNNVTNLVENGSTNNWTYDAINRVSAYKDVLGNLIQYHYDANGNLTNLVYPGGKNVYYAYDTLNRMTNVTDWSGRKTGIGYDLDSHVTSLVRPNGSSRTVSYDAAGQATNIIEQMGNSLPIATFKHGWTNTGCMSWEFAAPLPHTTTMPTRSMTYDADNRLSQFKGPTMGSLQSVSVDANGNLTAGPLTNDTFGSYSFDARNRLLSVGGVTNFYDAANNRIGQNNSTNTATFVVNPNAKLPQVLMRIKNGMTNYYIYGGSLLYQITETATSTNTLMYHYDYRGSTIALSADNGLVTDRIEYSAYGSTTYRVGTNDTPFLFNGRFGVQTDPNGLLYMRARYYNPYLCRFISADPSGFSGGLNHFAYADGNPVSLIDPFGLYSYGKIALGSLEIVGGVVAAAAVGLAEPLTFGAVTVAVPTVFLGITHGSLMLGAGLQPDPVTEQQQNILDIYPSGPGQLVGMAGFAFGPEVGKKTETIGGLLWDIKSVGGSTFEVLNSFADGEKMALPLTQFGVDSASLFSSSYDTAEMFSQNQGQNQNSSPNHFSNNSANSWLFQTQFRQNFSLGK